MRIIILVILLQIIPAGFLSGQNAIHESTIFFASDRFDLDETDQTEIKKVAELARQSPYYEITLTAHTDFDGSRQYNTSLSYQRAKAVKQYLVQLGIDSNRLNDAWYGETKPAASNLNEEGKQENRRVEIKLHAYHFNDVGQLLKTTGGDFTQEFKLQGDLSQAITGKAGTRVEIPSDAFVTPDGKPVPNGEVKIQLEEFTSMADAFYNKLSTQSDGKPLESGGMMKITATYKGIELKLANGKMLSVEMPSDNIQEGMTVFTGQRNENGVVEWVNTGTAFKAESRVAPAQPSLLVNVELVKTFIQPPHYVSHHLPKFADLRIPREPAKPSLPRKPIEPVKDDPAKVYSGIMAMVSTQKMREKASEKRYAAALKRYEEKMASYSIRMERYHANMEKYAIAMKHFEVELARLYRQVDSMHHEISNRMDELKVYYDKSRWNRALMIMISKVNKASFHNADVIPWLRNTSSKVEKNDGTYYKLTYLRDWVNFYGKRKNGELQRSL